VWFLTPGEKAESFVYVIYVSRSAFSHTASAIGRAVGARPCADFDVFLPRLRGEVCATTTGVCRRACGGQRLAFVAGTCVVVPLVVR